MSTARRISSLLSRDRVHQPNPKYTQAAVLIGIVQTPSGEQVIFNRRASSMNNHASEICLPGGVLECIDHGSHTDAALREANEEIGLPKENVQVIGVLESYVTSQHIEVTPIVAIVRRPTEWILQTHEVEEVVELPLSTFLEARNYRHISKSYYGREVNTVSITCNSCEIWGLTAKIMMQLQQLVDQDSN
ncbi:CoA pyrophosphatase [Marinobacter sp. TBZ242]|jgi:8-oxo-dGTP pyrophosphatase MutT (NUDIX family)|uniref:CoA pyrophosphatase n=1 Tax=Marinobacter azerbaijanicus TaxID=3050455 RepID=A0ABT7IGH5_9GAMM|nr:MULTISPECIES: CoA pyrophosphatase [Marinobacter]MBL3558951.1 CoA pyrophosphatase [Marinobacter sp. JB05H06]MDL0433277.1 CoA pyrophosphatase [Marinobacter sp. TBZ242]